MSEDGEQDAIHAGSVLESAHGSGAPHDFAETALDGVGGAHGAAVVLGPVAEAGEEIVEVLAKAGRRLPDGFGRSGRRRPARRSGAERTSVAFMILCRARLTAGWSASRTLLTILRILCAQQRCTAMPGKTVGMPASRPLRASTQTMSSRSKVRPRRWRSVRKRSHSAALSLSARRKYISSSSRPAGFNRAGRFRYGGADKVVGRPGLRFEVSGSPGFGFLGSSKQLSVSRRPFLLFTCKNRAAWVRKSNLYFFASQGQGPGRANVRRRASRTQAAAMQVRMDPVLAQEISQEAPPARRSGYIARSWRGEVSLARAFFVNCIAVTSPSRSRCSCPSRPP